MTHELRSLAQPSANVRRQNVGGHGQTGCMKPSQRYLRDSNLMMAFRNAYVELTNNVQVVPRGLTMTELAPAAGVGQQEWSRLYSTTAQAAGACASAYHRYGGRITLRNAAYMTPNVDLVANWEMSLRDPQQLDPKTVIASVESAIARARQQSVEAAERERGVTGLIAAFLRWPSTLREAVEPGRSGQRAAASVVGVAGQVLVGILGSVIATGLVALGLMLWRSAF